MKMKSLTASLLAIALGLAVSCRDQSKPDTAADESTAAAESTAATEAPATAESTDVATPAPATPATAEVPATPAPAVSPLGIPERAAMLGFAGHLPANTEVFLSLPNGTKTVSAFMKTKLWEVIRKETGAPATLPGDGDENAELPGPAALFSREFTLGFGHGTADQFVNLVKFQQLLQRSQLRAATAAFAEGVKTGDFSNVQDAFVSQEEALKEILNGPLMPVIEQAQMPPLYIAFKSTPEKIDEAAMQISGILAYVSMAGPIVEPAEAKIDEAAFNGYKVSGEAIAKQLESNRESMDEEIGKPTTDRLMAAIAKKNLVILTGKLDHYVVLFLGSSVEDFTPATDVSASLAASDSLAFFDAYKDKKHAFFSHTTQDVYSKLMDASTALGDLCLGIRDGLAGSDALGDTRDIQALCELVDQREKTVYARNTAEASHAVGFLEDGFKIETQGGTDTHSIDTTSTQRLSHLGTSPDTALFINMLTNREAIQPSLEYMEAIFHTAYAISGKVADVGGDKGELAEFSDKFKLFDANFSEPLAKLWASYKNDYLPAVGNESAIVLDLDGSAPTAPGLPQAYIDSGKFPRATAIIDVKDRAKLAATWEQINTSATAILAKVSEMKGENIPMQKPMSSEKDGFTTWFFSLPFCNNDFLPSVTLDDQWMALSTSKNQALDLLAKAKAGGATATGASAHANFRPLQTFIRATLDLAEKNQESFPMDDDVKKAMGSAADAMDDLDSLDFRAFVEGAKNRASLHIKTR